MCRLRYDFIGSGHIENYRLRGLKMPELQSAADKKWKAESDAQTLATANIIINDTLRLKAAKKAAENLAKDVANELAGLLKVAGKLQNIVEGMRVLSKD